MPSSALDIRRFGQAIKQAGIDPRHWVSYGTVGTVDDDGDIDFTDVRAVYIGPQGVECDVILEPLNIHVCAVYAGIAGGRETSFFAPIKPGDRVLVTLPDGDPTVPPVIVAVLHSAADRMPIANGKPIFQNNLVFLQTESVDIDVRTKNGGRVLIQQNGTVTTTATTVTDEATTVNENADHVNLGRSATQRLVLGDVYSVAEKTFLAALNVYIAAIQPIADPTGTATSTMTAAIGAFTAAIDASLSTVSKTA